MFKLRKNRRGENWKKLSKKLEKHVCDVYLVQYELVEEHNQSVPFKSVCALKQITLDITDWLIDTCFGTIIKNAYVTCNTNIKECVMVK